MGKLNEIKKSFKKRKKEIQKEIGEPQLNWIPCIHVRGNTQGWKAEITKEQSERMEII